MAPTTRAPLEGSVLAGRYELVGHLARGGTSDVYRGLDRVLGRPVAVKVFRGSGMADRARFDAEAQTLARLHHPGLVQVFDAGEVDGDPFVVLELIAGPSLHDLLRRRGRLAPREAAALGAAVADALGHVHEAGVVHRDVTPSNVLCDEAGRPRLADFGIARLVDTTRVTQTATALGTAGYLAPEQVEGRDVTPAADVYSLGLVLLEALTGRAPFEGRGAEAALARLARDPDIPPELPAPWAELLRAMTQRQPEDRPPARAVAERLEALVDARIQVATAPLVVGASTGAVDEAAPTEAIPVAEPTSVLPVGLQPVDVGPSPSEPPSAPARDRRALWLALAGAAALVVAVAAANDDGLSVPPPTSTPVSAAEVSVTTAPPTTAPPTTAAAPAPEGKGHDKGPGKGKRR